MSNGKRSISDRMEKYDIENVGLKAGYSRVLGTV